jgi:hypothetical protein
MENLSSEQSSKDSTASKKLKLQPSLTSFFKKPPKKNLSKTSVGIPECFALVTAKKGNKAPAVLHDEMYNN